MDPDPDSAGALTAPPAWTDSGLASLLLLSVLLLLSAFFSGSETAMTAVDRTRLHHRARHGDRKSRRILGIVRRPGEFLAAILIGNTLVNTAATAVGTAWLGPLTATAVITVLLLIFAEVIPKTLAAQIPERFARTVETPLRGLLFALRPLVAAMNLLITALLRPIVGRNLRRRDTLTVDELRTAMELGHQGGELSGNEMAMVRGVLELRETPVSELMIPRSNARTLSVGATVADLFAELRRSKHTRYPLIDAEGEVVGVIHVKDIFIRRGPPDLQAPVAGWRRELARIPHATPVREVLPAMQRTRTHMATVIDDNDEPLGFVTLEDLIEAIVGSIRDEHDHDEAPPVVELGPSRFRVRLSATVRDVNLLTPLHLPEHDDYETVAEMLQATTSLNHVAVGLVVEYGDTRLEIERSPGGRGLCAVLTPVANADEEDPPPNSPDALEDAYLARVVRMPRNRASGVMVPSGVDGAAPPMAPTRSEPPAPPL